MIITKRHPQTTGGPKGAAQVSGTTHDSSPGGSVSFMLIYVRKTRKDSSSNDIFRYSRVCHGFSSSETDLDLCKYREENHAQPCPRRRLV